MFESASIIGLGLIGGSLARDLAAAGVRVAAYDEDEARLRTAMSEGVVSVALDEGLSGVRESELVVIAVPVDASVETLATIAPHIGDARLVTDVGSTKARIVGAAEALGVSRMFVGSHPMAGDHKSGWGASRSGLFAGANVYLCGAPSTSRTAVDAAADFWLSLDGHPISIDATEHDQKLAWTSHLPHVLSAALGLALATAGVRRTELGPGGRDVTRLSGSSPSLWAAIARDNADALDSALLAAEQEVAAFRKALARPHDGELLGRFAAARRWFDE